MEHNANTSTSLVAGETAPRLARGVCRMLADHGYRTLCEFALGNGRRADVFALDRRGVILIVEVKTTAQRAARAEPAPASEAEAPDNTRDARRAMAATIWGEARSEPLAGRIAAGHVVRNRAADPGWWGKDVLICCLSPAQFSCWWDAQGQRVRTVDETDGLFRQCLQIAGEVMTGDLSDATGGADHYHRDDVRPAWAVGRKPIRTIWRHSLLPVGKEW